MTTTVPNRAVGIVILSYFVGYNKKIEILTILCSSLWPHWVVSVRKKAIEANDWEIIRETANNIGILRNIFGACI